MKQALIILIAILLFTSNVYSDEVDTKDIKGKLPQLLGSNNSGAEFYITFIPVYEQSSSDNYFKLYFSSEVETMVNISVPGIDFTRKIFLNPNDVIELEMTPDQAQPYRKALTEAPEPEQIYEGRGIHIRSD